MSQGREIVHTKENITESGARTGKLVQQGTVLISFKLSIGKVARAGIPLYTNEAIASLPIKDSKVLDSGYLMRALEAADLEQGSNRAAMGATLNKAKLAGVEISLPPLVEQIRISAILDRADGLRTQSRKALGSREALEPAIFHRLFGNRHDDRLPLKEVVDGHDRINYGVLQPGINWPGGIPLIRVSDLKGGAVFRKNLKLIDPAIEADYARSRISGTEILVSCVGSIGTVSVTSTRDAGSNIARAITRLPISDGYLRTYVAAYLRTKEPQRYFRSEARTVAQPTLNVKQLAAIEVPLPPRHLVERFAGQVESLSQQLNIAARAVALHEELFEGLQDRAFRGRF